MQFAAESPEEMQVAIEKRVHPNALLVKQQQQVLRWLPTCCST